MTPAFDAAFDLTIGHEGGYVNDPRDPGGETQWGISKRAYPTLDIKSLSKDDAKAIYWRDYWLPLGCDKMPAAVAYVVFDAGVNCGVYASAKFLQAALGATQDGVIGPKTLAALAAADPREVCAITLAYRMVYHTQAPAWPTYKNGWCRRMFRVAMSAEKLLD